MIRSIIAACCFAICVSLSAPICFASAQLKIGNTMPYSGPLAGFASVGKAAEAYLKKVNKEKLLPVEIQFVSYDDAYSPPQTMEQVRKLVEKDKVNFLFGILGTPTNAAVVDYINKAKVPQLFIYTGGTNFVNPVKYPYTIRWLPSYFAEARAYAAYVKKNMPNAKIGILYQNDAFGKDFLNGFKEEMGAAAKKAIVSEQSFHVTDPTIDSQMLKLKASGANVFMAFSTGKSTPQAIQKAASIGWKPELFVIPSVSMSIKRFLEPAGLNNAQGVVSSTYYKGVSDPRWKDDPAIAELKSFLKEYYPDADPTDDNIQMGLLSTQALVQVLKQCNGDYSAENILRQVKSFKDFSLPLFIPGVKINTSETDLELFEQFQLMKFDGSKWASFSDLINTNMIEKKMK